MLDDDAVEAVLQQGEAFVEMLGRWKSSADGIAFEAGCRAPMRRRLGREFRRGG